MIYAKSALAGLAALIITALLMAGAVSVAPFVIERFMTPANSSGGWYFAGAWIPLWLIVAVPLLVFSAVYFFTFRRLSRVNQRPR